MVNGKAINVCNLTHILLLCHTQGEVLLLLLFQNSPLCATTFVTILLPAQVTSNHVAENMDDNPHINNNDMYAVTDDILSLSCNEVPFLKYTQWQRYCCISVLHQVLSLFGAPQSQQCWQMVHEFICWLICVVVCTLKITV